MKHSKAGIQFAQAALQYAAPTVGLCYYFAAAAISVCILQNRRKNRKNRSRRAITYNMFFILVTYIVQFGLLLIDLSSTDPQISGVAANVNAIASVLLWSVLTALLHRTRRPVWYPYYGTWLITLVCEVAMLGLFASHHTVSRTIDIILIVVWVGRVAALLGLVAQYVTAGMRFRRLNSDEETASLLRRNILSASRQKCATNQSPGDYGSNLAAKTTHTSASDTEDSESDEQVDEQTKARQQIVAARLKKDGNWFTYLRGFSIFLPMIWPSKEPSLYVNMAGCVLCLMCGRVLRVLKPRQLGIVVNILTTGSGSLYKAIGLYCMFHWASSSAGIGVVQDWLWFPIKQYSNKRITTAAYDHVMELSRDFHDNKQSGELYKAIAQGSEANELLDLAIFHFAPTIVDIAVGYFYLYYLFGPYILLLAVAATIAYLFTATQLNMKQSSSRRELQNLARQQSQVMYDTVGSWATVAYFNRISYEESRFEKAVTLCVLAERLYYRLGSLFRAIGELTLEIGFCGALLLAAYQVSNGVRNVGDFVTLLSYWSIFSGPLAFLAYAHRHILRYLVDAEALLQLFQQKPKVKDGAKGFLLKDGSVQFNDVKFSYDGSKQIINGLSFTALPGQKIALVGETGGGKSTLLKLIFRFYDVTDGSLLIDGQDVRDVTVESLRDYIGVVPQDPSMFNDTIMNNVRYSKLDATDEQVLEACKAAAIHDKITSFPNGYLTKVGEKGVKLSGGELQRLAIARTILKNASIILLDEATSSVDTGTEFLIQHALSELTKGRTTFTVAHRLSTIVDADIILVIKDGMILERGSPKELLSAKGKYYDLWCKQVGLESKIAKSTRDKGSDGDLAPSESEQARPGCSEQRSIWRPDAPEFIPRHLQKDLEPIPSRQQQRRGSNDDKGDFSQPQPTENKTTSPSVSNQDTPVEPRDVVQNDAALIDADSGMATKANENAQQKIDMNGNESDGNHKRTRLNRMRRRRMSRSEPTGSSVGAGEGATEQDGTAPDDSAETPAPERRRVSAPSRPCPHEGGKVTGQGRRNRRKQWRIRKQSNSEAQSSLTFGAGSAEDMAPILSATPTSPGQDQGGSGKGENSGKGNVRFAHDA